jgi:DNA polymerase III delta prime subunit
MKTFYLIAFLTISGMSFGQTLGELYYNDSKPTFTPPPTQSLINSANRAEQIYYRNEEVCYKLEKLLTEELKKLTIDTLNIKFKKEARDILYEINVIQRAKAYELYTDEIIELIERVNNNYAYYQDEEEHLKKMYEKKLKELEKKEQKLDEKLKKNE